MCPSLSRTNDAAEESRARPEAEQTRCSPLVNSIFVMSSIEFIMIQIERDFAGNGVRGNGLSLTSPAAFRLVLSYEPKKQKHAL
jgi:hypothetical protein